MKVLIDAYVPFLRGVLEPYAEVAYLEPEEFTPATVRDADALIVRTRTKCNASLLDGSKVRFIATATIGYDHIDRAYCEAHGIYWTNSPGCNAQAVCDYVEEVLLETHAMQAGATIGVVGVGHVGSKVCQMAERYGLHVLKNDPPKQIGVCLDEIAEKCDIITFHTPLIKGDNPYPTYHLCDTAFLEKCRPGALIINAARGGIVDEEALLASGHPYVLDTWEGEPHLNEQVLQHALLATYHIAGYSRQGKVNASTNCLRHLCQQFGLPKLSLSADFIEKNTTAHIDEDTAMKQDTVQRHTDGAGDSEPGWVERISTTLKQRACDFELLRETYPLR